MVPPFVADLILGAVAVGTEDFDDDEESGSVDVEHGIEMSRLKLSDDLATRHVCVLSSGFKGQRFYYAIPIAKSFPQ